jgi:hypothetical protein
MTDQEKTAPTETAATASEAAAPVENCESGTCEAPEEKHEENSAPSEEQAAPQSE